MTLVMPVSVDNKSSNVAHLKGGEVGVETTPGLGSTFWFAA